jgi:hypothetical protein
LQATPGARLQLPALALLLLAAAAPAARASDPGVHAEFVNGAGRVTLDGSYAPAAGFGTSPSPNPLRDRGTLRVTAAIPAGDRAQNPARANGLPGEVTLVDMGGRVVRTLWRGTLDRLTFDVPFAARDARGQPLPPGLYFVVLRAGQHRSISRVAVVR